MQQRIASYHPDCQVQLIDDFVDPDNSWLVPSMSMA